MSTGVYSIKQDVLEFLGEPKGELVAGVPVGCAATSSHGPQKQTLQMKVSCTDQ